MTLTRTTDIFKAAMAIFILGLTAISVSALAEGPEELSLEETSIEEIMQNPSGYQGQRVVVEGEIVMECSAGCWFILEDTAGSIYVDLNPNNFAIPRKGGFEARVYGQVDIKDDEPYILGEIVLIDGEVYR
ncbi:MAG: hypothetical protein GKC10_08355 [Methanosarcinales archaeon]|nr:hypothetical protein [Methanosarcinales archaeon]